MVGAVVGAHQCVPEVEVEPIVAARPFVVHVVVGGGVEPPENGVMNKPCRENFVTQVPHYIPKQGPGGKEEQDQWVERDDQCCDRDDGDFYNRFKRVERQGSPGRWIERLMVDPM